jgi:hypothetical protein
VRRLMIERMGQLDLRAEPLPVRLLNRLPQEHGRDKGNRVVPHLRSGTWTRRVRPGRVVHRRAVVTMVFAHAPVHICVVPVVAGKVVRSGRNPAQRVLDVRLGVVRARANNERPHHLPRDSRAPADRLKVVR